MPMMRDAFPDRPDVAPMDLLVFLSWGAWDLVLILAATALLWTMLDRLGPSLRSCLIAGTVVWAAVFVLLWIGLLNMNLAPISVPAVALPLAWIEMVVAAVLVRWAILRNA